VAAALGALRDDDVDAGGDVLLPLIGAAAERRDEASALVDAVDHLLRRRAERVGDELHLLVSQRDVDLRCRGRLRPAEQLLAARLVAGQLGHAVVGEDLRAELAMLERDHLLQLGLELRGIHLAHALVLAGDHDVDAVGLVADVLIDPLELDLELLRREADGAEHAEAPRLRDGGDHVAAVGEGEDRELDAEPVAERGLHA
jgi:hypothetical protein